MCAPPVLFFLSSAQAFASSIAFFTPSKGVRISHVTATPSEGVLRTQVVPSQPQDVYRPFHSQTDFHSFGRRAGYFSSTFRRWANAPQPREPIVATFADTSCRFHLPKVRNFHAFYAHLPKVRKGHTAPRAYCSHVCRYIMPIPPSEGEKFPAFYAHLPKVGKGHTAPRAYCSYVFRYILPIPPSEGEKFPAFYAHLPKVGKGHTAPRAYCCHVCRYILPIQPSEGEKFPRVLCTPSEGDPALFPCIVKALSRDTAKVQPFRHYTAA